jgi:hypothetical protein
MPPNASPAFARFSSEGTKKVFNGLLKNLTRNRWLTKNNRYINRCTIQIDEDIVNGTLALPHIADYIAASVPLHCIDGWSLFGKALLCESLGDSDGAKHFAYYAELRAAMSILGAGGIGIFGTKHFEIEANVNVGGPIKMKGTHIALRSGLDKWSKSADAVNLIKKVIRPEGIPLEDWFAEFTQSTSSPINWLAEKWLHDWGYDLLEIEDHQKAREHSSYRPTRLKRAAPSDPAEIIRLMTNVWDMSSPTAGGGMTIDLYLLRLSVDAFYKTTNKKKTKAVVEKVVVNLGFTGYKKDLILKALLDPIKSALPLVLRQSSLKTNDRELPSYSIQMLSRAFLLLRLSAGASSSLMEDCHVKKENVEFWWKPLGEARGLWDSSYQDPLLDMWVEVEEALSNLRNSSSSSSHLDSRLGHSHDFLVLGGCERIALSTICL